MAVPHVKIAGGKISKDNTTANTYLYVDEFVDRRENKSLARNEKKKEVQPESDVAPAAVDALKQSLSAKGFSFSESAPLIISGELREWIAEISGSLPTKVSAQASVYIEVLDPANKKIYSGVYRGYSSMEEASVDEQDISRTLASSLEESVSQVTNDKQLISLLSSY
jgi:uncharacterized lipoprotein YajG